MAVIKVDEFRGDHNKLYLVTRNNRDNIKEFKKIAKARFKVANNKLIFTFCYIAGNELYLNYCDIPTDKTKKACFKYVAYVFH